MSSPPVFSLRNLTAGYGERTALRAVSMDIEARSTTVLVGPGGGGKSTLLCLLAGEAHPRGADTRPYRNLEGNGTHDRWQTGRLSRPDGPVVFLRQQEPSTSQTVRELLSLASPGEPLDEPLTRLWAPAQGASQALLQVLEVPLDRLASPMVLLVRVSVALSRRGPGGRLPVLLLDEPEATLSDEALDWVIAKLKERRGHQTIVLATHHLRLAREVGDYVAFFLDGEIVEAGKAGTFFASPTKARTQDFVRMGG